MGIHPEELLKSLLARAVSRKKRNLLIVHDVCRAQYEAGRKDFSIALIARLARERNGPAAQSMYNKSGDDFKALIQAWAVHAGSCTRQPRSRDDMVSQVLGRLADPSLTSAFGRGDDTGGPKSLSNLELAALRGAFSEQNLTARHWRIDVNGAIVDREGRQIFDAPFAFAIQKLLSANEYIAA